RTGRASLSPLRSLGWSVLCGRFRSGEADPAGRGARDEEGTHKARGKAQAQEDLTELGLNTPEHLERSLNPPKTFDDVADAWIERRLPPVKESTRDSAPLVLAKHLRPYLGRLALENIKTGTVNARDCGPRQFPTSGSCFAP